MAKAPPNIPAVLPDVPALEDKLNFGPYARTLLDIILNPNTQTPLTIGIFGSWGSGKTSLMKMIEAGLKRPNRQEGEGQQIFPVWFNAWLYSKEEALWRALVMQVLGGLRKIRDIDAAARAELSELADQLFRAVGPAELGSLSIAAADLLKEDGTSAAQITLTLQHGLDFLENIATARQQGELAAAQALSNQVQRATAILEQERIESLDKFQKQFKALVEKHVLPRGYLVIFVDDLDRCLPDKAVEVLEAIKLFLDVPGCIFILGIDRDVVERGIRLRYGEMASLNSSGALPLLISDDILEEGARGAAKYRAFLQGLSEEGQDIIDGGRYLEKIVQIPFVLPPISPLAMGNFVATLTPNLPDSRCGLVFVRGLDPNPRQVKRSLNIFALLWGLAQQQPYLADRISPVRLAKLVVLQQRHSDLYEQLRQDPSLIISWERAFRVRRDKPGFLSWARGSEGWTDSELLALESEIEELQNLPDQLRIYEDLPALESLLTMHPLTGEASEKANFVNMTPERMHELIFLARTAEGGGETFEKEPVYQRPQQVMEAEEADTPEFTDELYGPVPLHKSLFISGEESGFIARRVLGQIARVADEVGQGASPDERMIAQLADAGLELTKALMGSWGASDMMSALEDQPRTVQVHFSGPEGSAMIRLPWEMVYDRDKDPFMEKVTLADFWGGRHIIERPLALTLAREKAVSILPHPPLAKDRVPRVGLVLDWGIDANPALEMFSKWNESGRIQLKPIEEPEAFRHSLLEEPANIYVIYGRGWQEVGEGVIGIGKGYPLTAKEIKDWIKPRKKRQLAQKIQETLTAPHLFYFGLSGDSSQEIDWSAWLSALQFFDTGGIIAPQIYTSGKWPLELMSLFFEQFFSGQVVGKTLLAARQQFFEKTGNPLGLLYSHFGPPEMQLFQTESDEDKEE